MSDVKIRILAEDKASAAINQVDKSLDRLATDAGIAGGKNGIGGLSASLGATLTSVMGLVGGIGILAGALAKTKAFIFDSVNFTVEYAQAVRELSMAIGASAEETSRLLQLADDYMIDTDKMATALRFATKNGFEVSIDAIARLADELRGIADPNEKAAKLVEIFGRNWSALIPLLNAGGDAIRKNAAAIQEGLLLDEVDTSGVFAYQQALDNLNDTIEVTKIRIGTGLVPTLTDLIASFNQSASLGDQMSASFKAFNGIIDQSNRSALAFEEAFRKGLDISPEGLIEIAKQLQAIEDPLQRVVMAERMFGENWVEVYAIFEQSIPTLMTISGLVKSIGPDMDFMSHVTGVSNMSKQLDVTEEAIMEVVDAEGEMEGAVIDAAKAMADAAVDAQLLTSSLYGVAQAAFTVANAVIAAKKAFANFGDLKMNLGDTAGKMAAMLDYSQRGGKSFEIMTQAAIDMAMAMDSAGAMTGVMKEKWDAATQAAQAFQTANEYFMGDIGARDLRDFAKTSQYAADALYTVYSNAVQVGQIDFAQASQEIARGLGIPLSAAEDKLSQFMSGAQQSVTMSVIIQFVATGDLWALSYGGGNWQTGINARGNPFFNPTTTGPNPFQYGSGFAQGADFVVPGGHPADNFPVWVSSGERVTVTPASKVAGDTYYDIQINSMPSQSPSEIANSVVWKLNEHQRLSRAAGAGYAGR